MSLFDDQFVALKGDFPSATFEKLADGSFTVAISDFQLPAGWTAAAVTVRFIAPVGYPQSKPDCFWCDHDLRLAGGGAPKNSGANPMPNGPAPLLWFSWHTASWSANADTLRTYVHVIKNRFLELQ